MSATSVEVESEAGNGDEKVLLDHSYCCEVVRVLVPELAGAHSHALTLVFANNCLDQVLVACVFAERSHALLRLFGQLFDERLMIVVARHVGR